MADFDPWIRPLISLIGLSGSLAYALAQIRSGIGRSAILLRDFLLDTKVSAETGIPDLIALRMSLGNVESSLDKNGGSISAELEVPSD
ncbi:MAG: hypothetical protein ACJ74Y_04210 [Bryobacteraceae bacterium]